MCSSPTFDDPDRLYDISHLPRGFGVNSTTIRWRRYSAKGQMAGEIGPKNGTVSGRQPWNFGTQKLL